jgi:hypothetical protein
VLHLQHPITELAESTAQHAQQRTTTHNNARTNAMTDDAEWHDALSQLAEAEWCRAADRATFDDVMSTTGVRL